MPQDTLELRDSLIKGLRPDSRVARNSGYLSTSRGGKSKVFGMSAYSGPTQPFSAGTLSGAGVTIAHPFPQLFRGRRETLLADNDMVYTVNESSWALTQPTVRSATPSTEYITNGDFSNASGWTQTSGTWSITGGKATLTALNVTNLLQQASGDLVTPLSNNTLYLVTIDITFPDPPTSSKYVELILSNATSSKIHHSGRHYFYANVTNLVTPNFYISVTQALGVSFDNVSVKAFGSGTISAGGSWHFADGGEIWVMTNGTSVVFRNPYDGRIYTSTTNVPQTCTYHRGRFMYGGFSTSFSAFDNFIPQLDTALVDSVGPSTVYWTSVNAGDALALWLTGIYNYGPRGGFTAEDDPYWLEMLQRQDSGIMDMPSQGEIQCLKPLDEGVMCYAENGISYLAPFIDPVPTYGRTDLIDIGVAGRSAVAGDPRKHIFVLGTGDLWSVDAARAVSKLGYAEYFLPLLGDDIVASFDSEEREFYFSNDEDCFILTESGLSQIPELVTSVATVSGGLVGIKEAADDVDFKVITDTIDLGGRKLKTILSVELGMSDYTLVDVYLHHRMEDNDAFTVSGPYDVDRDGVARVQISCVEFRVEVRAAAYSGISIDYLNVVWTTSTKASTGHLIT